MPVKSKLLIIALVLFSILGTVFTHTVLADITGNVDRQIEKFSRVMRFAQLYYVEEVDWNTVMEGAISGMLAKMDPHSVYVSQDEVQEYTENFSGKYEGIGIEYEVIDGYLTVIAPIPGSPSDLQGLQTGDRIVRIEGESAYGLAQEDVQGRLKGPKGTSVMVTVQREGVEGLLEFVITRDVIPIFTVRASFMTDDSTGYIWVTRFASITADEVEEKLVELEGQGLRQLVLDLRWNSGGYLHEAVKLAGKFIKGHNVIVYTQGRIEGEREKFYPQQFGRRTVRNYPVVILLNRGSASASEIVAGAVQDYDRGLVIGENSFGKGLVQKQFPLPDGSAVRVTTAKYYTPSGRCIQRDYKGKDIASYYDEVPDSVWVAEDSLRERPLYHTLRLERPVYGGGGIQPDIYVRNQMNSRSPRLSSEILRQRLFFDFAHDFASRNAEAKRESLMAFATEFTVGPPLLEAFQHFCRERGIEMADEEFQKDAGYFAHRLHAEIARQYWDNQGYYFVLIAHDSQFLVGVQHLEEARQLMK